MSSTANISFTVIHPDRNKIESIRFLSKNTFVLSFERNDICFKAGQHLTIGKKNSIHRREYSVYSGEDQDQLEILVREVLEGNVSLQLRDCVPGDILEAKGGFGKLVLSKADISFRKHVFIASGTGIAPFHSYVKSYPDIDYTLIHGVRNSGQAYDRDHYEASRYVLCTSRDETGDFHGRVTDYLRQIKIDPNTLYHICGNSKMIYEVYDILRGAGVQNENIRSEVYF